MATFYDTFNRGASFSMGLEKDQRLVRTIMVTGVSPAACKWGQLGLPNYREPHMANEDIVAGFLHATQEPDDIGVTVYIEYVTPDVLLTRTGSVDPEPVEGVARLNSYTELRTVEIPYAITKWVNPNPPAVGSVLAWFYDYVERHEPVTYLEASWQVSGLNIASFAQMHNQVNNVHKIGPGLGFLFLFVGGSHRQIDTSRWEVTAKWLYDDGTRDIGGNIPNALLWPDALEYDTSGAGQAKPTNYIRGPYQELTHVETDQGGAAPIKVALYDKFSKVDLNGWQNFPGVPPL